MSDLVGNPEGRFSHNEAHIASTNKPSSTKCHTETYVTTPTCCFEGLLHRSFNGFQRRVQHNSERQQSKALLVIEDSVGNSEQSKTLFLGQIGLIRKIPTLKVLYLGI